MKILYNSCGQRIDENGDRLAREPQSRRWFAVLATGDVGRGPVAEAAEQAWEAWERLAHAAGYADSQLGTARASCSARLVVFGRRSDARRADISDYPSCGGTSI